MTTPNRPARPWDIFNRNIQKLTDEEASKRMSICESCEFLIPITKNCKKCGCFMVAKTKLPHASCPIGKWDAITNDVSIYEETNNG